MANFGIKELLIWLVCMMFHHVDLMQPKMVVRPVMMTSTRKSEVQIQELGRAGKP